MRQKRTHEVHQLTDDNEVWCGGTEPPTVVTARKVGRRTLETTAELFPEGVDVHKEQGRRLSNASVTESVVAPEITESLVIVAAHRVWTYVNTEHSPH